MFFARAFALIVLLWHITGCVSLPTPTSPVRSPTPATQPFVDVAMFGENGRGAIAGAVGSTVTVTLALRPSQRATRRARDGTPVSVTTEWKNHTVAQMRYCVGQNCDLPNEWQAFAPQVNLSVSVDWVGLRDYVITAQFRDASGVPIPAGYGLNERTTGTLPITGMVDERTPSAARPAALQTVVARAANELPVTGKLDVGERPIVGGKAGTRIDIPVRFEASSPRGAVKELRVKFDRLGRCLTPNEMNDARWEPFVAEKIFPVSIAINWNTFKVHVQYRDAANNLSPVYCGEIAIEGMP